MKHFRIGIALFVTIMTIGCTNRYQHQVDQSLLLQENRRLEDALYVTHAQLVDLKRENEALRAVGNEGSSKNSSTVRPRGKRIDFAPRDDYDDAPPFETPKVDIPLDSPGSNLPPPDLKTLDSVPKPAEEITFPELSLPAWSPTR